MDSSKFLIIGARGQLGTALQERYPDAHAVDSAELNIADRAALEKYDWKNVSVILNAAAYTAVDGAETPQGRVAAWEVNAHGVSNLARVAVKHNLTLVHVSTDYVFDGTRTPHREDEPVSPLGVYGQSKAAGDIAALTHDKTYVLRTSWVIGEGKNFVRTMIGLAARNVSPSVVNDQIGRLTFTRTLVDAIDHLLAKEAPFGVYNVSNGGAPVSWAEVTRSIFHNLDRDDLSVQNATTADYFADKPEASPRPLQSTLDLTKLESTGFKVHDWETDLKEYIKQETEGQAEQEL